MALDKFGIRKGDTKDRRFRGFIPAEMRSVYIDVMHAGIIARQADDDPS